jgi:hypothetical protein
MGKRAANGDAAAKGGLHTPTNQLVNNPLNLPAITPGGNICRLSSDAAREKAVQMLRDGHFPHRVATYLGVSHQTLQRHWALYPDFHRQCLDAIGEHESELIRRASQPGTDPDKDANTALKVLERRHRHWAPRSEMSVHVDADIRNVSDTVRVVDITLDALAAGDDES